jgi:hypothetical protein
VTLLAEDIERLERLRDANRHQQGVLTDDEKHEKIRERAAELGHTPTQLEMDGVEPYQSGAAYVTEDTWAETIDAAGLPQPAVCVARWIANAPLPKHRSFTSHRVNEAVGYSVRTSGQLIGNLYRGETSDAALDVIERSGRQLEVLSERTTGGHTTWGIVE